MSDSSKPSSMYKCSYDFTVTFMFDWLAGIKYCVKFHSTSDLATEILEGVIAVNCIKLSGILKVSSLFFI